MQKSKPQLSTQFKTYHLQIHSSTDRQPRSYHRLNLEKYNHLELTQAPRTKSEFARRTLIKTSRDPKWRNIFQSNGISADLGNQRLTHRDIARLSQIIKKQSKALSSIRKILFRFQQQVKAETSDNNQDKTSSQKRNQFIQNFTLKIKSHMPQQLYIHSQNTRTLTCAKKLVLPEKIQRPKTESKKIRISKTKSLLNLKVKKIKQFQIDSEVSKQFEHKLYKYLQFLFLINLSNRVFRELDSTSISSAPKYNIGFGNNSLLIHSIMKKRSWWEQGNKEESNFIWTQIKIKSNYSKQNISQNQFQKFEEQIVNQNQSLDTQKQPILKLIDGGDWNYIKKTLQPNKQKFKKRIQKLKKFNIIFQNQPKQMITNHIPNNHIIGNKKDLFLSLKLYYSLIGKDIWSIVPQTYYIKNIQDQQYHQFVQSYNKHESKVWIIKPSELSNRGQGIIVSDNLETITGILKSDGNSKYKTFIVQHYINNPYLYNRRKFDIRAYMLLTTNNGVLKGYWYQQGYIRTSSQIFDLSNLDNTYTHLTNDAIQKNSKKYGKYQQGNKLSYADFQRYLVGIKSKYNFYTECLPKMKKIARDSVRATALVLNRQKYLHNFEVFGLDFMINSRFEVNLIEINTNPCLETSCTLLSRIIPSMMENAFRIGLDPIFPPPYQTNVMRHSISENAVFFNRFELIFDEIKEMEHLKRLYSEKHNVIVNQQQQQENEEDIGDNQQPL